MAKRRKAAGKRATRRPARRRSRNPDATVNTLVILVVIMLVLGGLYFYAQNNKRQAFLFPSLAQVIAAFISAAPTGLMPDITGSIPATKPASGAKTPAAGSDITLQPTSSLEAVQPATVGAAHVTQDN